MLLTGSHPGQLRLRALWGITSHKQSMCERRRNQMGALQLPPDTGSPLTYQHFQFPPGEREYGRNIQEETVSLVLVSYLYIYIYK